MFPHGSSGNRHTPPRLCPGTLPLLGDGHQGPCRPQPQWSQGLCGGLGIPQPPTLPSLGLFAGLGHAAPQGLCTAGLWPCLPHTSSGLVVPRRLAGALWVHDSSPMVTSRQAQVDSSVGNRALLGPRWGWVLLHPHPHSGRHGGEQPGVPKVCGSLAASATHPLSPADPGKAEVCVPQTPSCLNAAAAAAAAAAALTGVWEEGWPAWSSSPRRVFLCDFSELRPHSCPVHVWAPPRAGFQGLTSLAAGQGAGAFSPDKYGWCPVGHSVQRLGWAGLGWV